MGVKLKLHGVRGSRPTHKPQLLGFGGNSTSVEFEIGKDFYLFLDGGSGLVRRGRELTQNSPHSKFYFLITHTHWDHLLGFPFFEPIYNPKNEFVFHASKTSRASFFDLFSTQNRKNNIPIPPAAITAKLDFKSIAPQDQISIENSVTVKSYQLNHQGITLGYRVEHDGESGIVITDNAPIENGNYMGEGMQERAKDDAESFEKEFDQGLIEFLRDADNVVFDTHFTEENLKADWGHSTPPRALKFCAEANVKRLILFHHAPEDSDKDVQAKVDSVIDEGKKLGVEVVAAKEGDRWAA